ncbi:MAG: ATP-binding protein, partial [Rhodospirillaceae bacterium]
PPLAAENILALLHDGAALWAGGSMGLARIPLDGSPTRLYRSTHQNPDSLNNTNVQAIFRDHAQRLWLGTDGGLGLLEDSSTGAIRTIVNDPKDPHSLPSNVITDIAEDKFKRLWLATANGIGIFDPAQDGKPRFIRLGKPQGLGNDTVLSVIEGSGGRIFAATGDGLSVIDPETLAVRTFGPPEGLALRTFWNGSATRMTDGTLVMGGFGGFVVVRPSALPTWDFRPPVVVTETRVGGRRLSGTEDLIVRPDDVDFQVDFSALDFSAPERNSYAYRLNDEGWVKADSLQRTARYTNLPPGLHRLELMGSSSIGTWGDPLTLDIRVLPAWYQTAWFRVLVSLAVLASLGGIMRGRKTYHLRRELELNRMVAIKTAEAEAATQRALAGEEDARRAKENAEAATEQKSRFLAIIGHEIRTPLNGLLGMVQVLSPTMPRADQQEALNIAKQAGENLRHLVESVLEYGREGAETTPVAVENFDLRRLTAEAVHLILPQAAAKGLAVTLRVEPDQPLWVRSSPAKLSRILLNLLGNAIKFTDCGSVAVTVVVASDGAVQRLTVRVTDTGIGVAPDLREAIFGEFIQADDSITRRFGGVGLGLAISRRLAAQLGGTLHLENLAAVGSSFVLDIPVTPGIAESRDDDSPLPAHPHSLHILVVDDDDINLLVADRLLTHLGQRVSLATNGADAVAALKACEFDAVLMDLRMPDMDGIEATRRIRSQEVTQGRTRVRIVAMTADISETIWQQCQAAGMDAAIAKPVRVEQLREALIDAARSDQPLAGLDMEFIQDQLDILGPREMIRLARLFQKISRDILRGMAAAAKDGDAAGVGALAHRLASAAGPLGLTEVSVVAGRLEAVSATASPDQINEDISLVHQARRKGLNALRVAARRIAGDAVRSDQYVRQSGTRRP